MSLRNRGFASSLATIFACTLSFLVGTPSAQAFDAKRWDQSVLRVIMFEIKADGKRADSFGVGTGFVIDGEYVLTNEHVVDDSQLKQRGSKPQYVVVDGSVKNLRPAQVIWVAPQLDLALIRVPGLKRPPLTLSSAAMKDYPGKGETVWAIGYPAIIQSVLVGEEGMHSESTITKGVVSKITQGSMVGGKDTQRAVIQHNAAINKGNSGGPLFDDCGVVLGVNTFAPYAIFEVVQHQGRQVAHGVTNTGVFFAPHIGNFLAAQKTVPELRNLSLSVSSEACPTAMGEAAGLPIWLYPTIGFVVLLALAATVLALRRGTTREVVRMVESYSAYVKRKGRPPSEASMQPRPVSAPPDISMPGKSASGAAATVGDWRLSGKGSQGQALSLSFSAEAVAAATAKKEGGLILGRSTSLADKAIDDPSISRRHAKIYATADGLAVEDLKSAHGTKVNGHRLEPFQAVELKAGDTLALGGAELTLGRGR